VSVAELSQQIPSPKKIKDKPLTLESTAEEIDRVCADDADSLKLNAYATLCAQEIAPRQLGLIQRYPHPDLIRLLNTNVRDYPNASKSSVFAYSLCDWYAKHTKRGKKSLHITRLKDWHQNMLSNLLLRMRGETSVPQLAEVPTDASESLKELFNIIKNISLGFSEARVLTNNHSVMYPELRTPVKQSQQSTNSLVYS